MRAWMLFVVAAALGVAAWLLLAEPRPEPGPPDEGARLEGGSAAAGLITAEGVATGADPADSFASETDMAVLCDALCLLATRPQAVQRLRSMLTGRKQLILDLIRRMHPRNDRRQNFGERIRAGVTEVLTALGDPALDLLLGEIDDANAIYRVRVIAVIGAFGKSAERVVPHLVRHMRAVDEDPPAAEVASTLNALAWIGPASKDVLPDVYRWLDEGATEAVEIAASRALVMIGGPTAETFVHARKVLEVEAWHNQRGVVLSQLGLLRERATPMIPVLLELVDEGVLDEGDAMKAFANIGVPDPAVIKRMVKRLRAGDPRDEWGLADYVYVLLRLGPRGEQALFEVVEEKSLFMRAAMVHGLLRADVGEQLLVEALEPAFAAEDPEVRRAVWKTLASSEYRPRGPLIAHMLRALEDSEPQVRVMSVYLASRLTSLSRRMAAALLATAKNEEESTETRASALGAMTNHEAYCTREVLDVLLAFQETAAAGHAPFRLIPFVRAYPDVVLPIWVAAVRKRGWRPRVFWHALGRLEPEVQKRHAAHLDALDFDPKAWAERQKRRRRR